MQVTRDKNVIKPAPGKRECNCRARVVTRQLGPGMCVVRSCCPHILLARSDFGLHVIDRWN